MDSKVHLKPLALMALFEDEFSIDWILEISGLKAVTILDIVETAVHNGQLEKKRPGIYVFKDEKARLSASGILTEEEKEKWHRSIAGIFFRELLNESEAVLAAAGHLLHLTNDELGCRQLLKAGDAYRKSYRNVNALKCYRKVIFDLDNIRSEEVDALYCEAVLSYAKIAEAGPDIQEVIAALKKAVTISHKKEDEKLTAMLEMNLAKHQWFCLNYREARIHFDRGRRIAQTMDDPALNRSALAFNQFFLYQQARFRDVIENYEGVISDIDRYPKGRFPLLSEQVVGISYAYNGQIERGMGLLNAIYDQCQKAGDDYVGSYVALNIGILMTELGRYDDAIFNLNSALKLAMSSSNKLLIPTIHFYLARAHYISGHIEDAEKCLNESLGSLEIVFPEQPSMIHWHPELLWAMEWGLFPEIEGFSGSRAIASSNETDVELIRGVSLRYRALTEERLGTPSDMILEILSESEKYLGPSGHEIEIARTRMEMARHFLLKGEEEKAKEVIRKSSDLLNSFLYNQVPDSLRFLLKDLRSDKNLLEEIMKLGQELATIRDHQYLVRKILATVNQITGAERGAVFLLNPEEDPPEMELRAARNITAEDISQAEFSVAMASIQNAAESGKPVFRFAEPPKKAYPPKSKTVHSFICVPLKLRDAVLGVLYVDNRVFPSALKESDTRILDYFSAQAAIALDNANVKEKYRKLLEKLDVEAAFLKDRVQISSQPVRFIGKCPSIRQLFEDANKAAATDATVLILGETGVGKELIAETIHYQSARSKRAFIRVNCSMFPETLIASELFGYEKGAFTGADKTHPGRFELADGGTLFLDEIGDIPPEVQVRLLRVLQNKEFERIGGRKTLHSDFRLLAATNRDLGKDVESGKFREDLYYRLNVLSLVIPPLRERKEDIPLLAVYFLDRYSKKFDKKLSTISDSDMNRLKNYDWPGNVRELENIIERAAILSSGSRIRIPDAGDSSTYNPAVRENISLQENEKRHILWMLKKTDGKIYGPDGAAKVLEINPNTLVSRMKKLGIRKKGNHVSMTD